MCYCSELRRQFSFASRTKISDSLHFAGCDQVVSPDETALDCSALAEPRNPTAPVASQPSYLDSRQMSQEVFHDTIVLRRGQFVKRKSACWQRLAKVGKGRQRSSGIPCDPIIFIVLHPLELRLDFAHCRSIDQSPGCPQLGSKSIIKPIRSTARGPAPACTFKPILLLPMVVQM